MRLLSAWLPLGRVLVVLDVVLAVWTVAWVIVGFRVADNVEGLTHLSDTVVTVGGALDSSGQALGSLDGLPLVGDRVRDPAGRIRAAGQSAVASGQTARRSVHHLSPLLGFAIALIPTIPLLAIYVPLRVAVVRERRAVGRLVSRHRDDPRLPRLLAQRAISRLDYPDLAAATLEADAIEDGGATGRLAEAELERLGVNGDRLRA